MAVEDEWLDGWRSWNMDGLANC